MKNEILVKFIALALLSLSATTGLKAESHPEINQKIREAFLMQKKDAEARIAREYLESKRSPLSPYSKVFIDASYKNGLDWRFLIAITGIESGFGKHLIEESYNPFGWGGGYIYFDNYEKAIHTVAEGLKDYKYRYGASTIDEIAPIYTPPNWRRWKYSIKYFISEMETVDTQST